MKITVEKGLCDCSFRFFLNDRTTVKQSIMDCPNNEGSFIHGVVVTQNGIVTKVFPDYSNSRTDIAVLEFHDKPFGQFLFDAMLFSSEAKLSRSEPRGINWTQDMTDTDYNYFQSVIDEWFVANRTYARLQSNWFNEKAWLHIKPGMGCDEAVKILTELGW